MLFDKNFYNNVVTLIVEGGGEFRGKVASAPEHVYSQTGIKVPIVLVDIEDSEDIVTIFEHKVVGYKF